MKFHYLQHAEGEDIGNMREWFEARGWQISSTQLHTGESLPAADSFDWLGIMGGPMSAYDESIYPWLVEEKRFIRAAVATGKVVVGICLGSQLLADVLGARVYRAPHQEIGWFEIRKCQHPPYNPASWLPEHGQFLCWHGDTFELPAGAALLASSACTPNQGFLWGDNVVALQFHLEAMSGTPEAFADAESSGVPGVGPFVQEWIHVTGDERLYSESRVVMHHLLDHLEMNSARQSHTSEEFL